MIHRIEPDGVFGLPELVSQVSVPAGLGLAFISGQVAWDEEGRVVGEGDHTAQAAQVARRIDRLLDALGAQRQDIVKETVYVVDHEPHLVPGILGALHGSPPPSSTLVGVAKLFAPEFLIEVECVVALPDGKQGFQR
ncbi:RidA family protein [Streptomyces sp. NPDC044780]|uniref:RidA family protein n=1 Tax=Streptomyces luomodiensis TaxID=3026192 RepID=A0ABY9US98_9ACTN|nr:RidA family protein [Streptomyces sp. SCA4-21]WNE95432.1 RidA family protein [Streptomyces sp. SCA4-21]